MSDTNADSESYIAVLKASYDYAPQSDDEIAIKEDQLLLLIEKTDEEWWKVKIKSDSQNTESAVGLVPSAYVEQAEHTSLVKAVYDYAAAAPGELTVHEGDILHVFDTEEDWILVQIQAGEGGAGYVPGNYVEATSSDTPTVADRIIVPDSPIRPVSTYVDPADRVASSKVTADDIKTWSISEVDKKGKKKKGTLGVGNGAVFFASESDKTPVQKWQTVEVMNVSIEKSKHVHIDIGGSNATNLHFHAGSKDNAEEIVAKLKSSKALSAPSSDDQTSHDARRLPPLSATAKDAKKMSVHFSPSSPVIIPDREQEEGEQVEEEEEPDLHQHAADGDDVSEETVLALYDFTADGEDELSVAEGEHLTILERDGDEWWKCRNAKGVEGVVPASYLETVTNGTASSVPEARSINVEDHAAEEHRLAREAEEEAEREEAERRQREEEERARKKQEAQRRAKDAATAAEAERRRRKEAAAARVSPPPKVQPPAEPTKPSENGTHASSSKGSAELTRPPPEKTRVWHDRSGQFRVEAAFLGFSNGKLRLHKTNGVIVEVPAEKMSIEDMRHVERVMSKKQRNSNGVRISDDDVPLAISRMVTSSGSSSNAIPPPKKSPKIDWFDFFLSAGCDLDDCTRYAASFEKDKMDETLLPDITDSTMRSLGLREGDIIRVKKAIEKRKPADNLIKSSPYVQEQLRRDEELARQLQAQEHSGGGRSPAPNLIAGPGGVLKGTRRGRPQPSKTLPPSNVDIKAIASASDTIQRTSSPQALTPSSAQPPSLQVPQRSASATLSPITNGFDDDAWTNRPSSTKPLVGTPPSATPRTPSAPPASVPAAATSPTATATAPAPQATQAAATTTQTSPSLAKTKESDIFSQLARLTELRKTSSPAQLPPVVSPSPFASPPPPSGFQAGMGMGSSPVPMGHIQVQAPVMQQVSPQPYNGPRGPFAPVASNQSLLQPLIPTQTGFTSFVPTRPPDNPQLHFQNQNQLIPSMFMQPSNNLSAGPLLPQQTGIQLNNGFGSQVPFQTNSGFGQIQSHMTGFNGGMTTSPFGGLAVSIPPVPPLPPMSNNNSNTSPANVFAQMKSGTFAVENENAPRPAEMYDALRPNPSLQMQATGWGQPYQQQFMGYQR